MAHLDIAGSIGPDRQVAAIVKARAVTRQQRAVARLARILFEHQFDPAFVQLPVGVGMGDHVIVMAIQHQLPVGILHRAVLERAVLVATFRRGILGGVVGAGGLELPQRQHVIGGGRHVVDRRFRRGGADGLVVDGDIVHRAREFLVERPPVVLFTRTEGEAFIVVITDIHGQAGGVVGFGEAFAGGVVHHMQRGARVLVPSVPDLDIVTFLEGVLVGGQFHLGAVGHQVKHLDLAILRHAQVEQAVVFLAVVFATADQGIGAAAVVVFLFETDADRALVERFEHVVIAIDLEARLILIGEVQLAARGAGSVEEHAVLRDPVRKPGVLVLGTVLEIPKADQLIDIGRIVELGHLAFSLPQGGDARANGPVSFLTGGAMRADDRAARDFGAKQEGRCRAQVAR